MARSLRIRRFQVKSRRVEKEKLQIDKAKLQVDKDRLISSNDFKEITLAITLLAGIGAILLSIIDYSAKNSIKESFQGFVSMPVSLLLFVFSMIFIFLLLKGYLASQKNRNKKIENITEKLFKYIFLISILWFILLISTPIVSSFENIFVKSLVQIFLAIVIILILIFAYGFDLKEISAIRTGEKRYDFNFNNFFQFFVFAAILIF